MSSTPRTRRTGMDRLAIVALAALVVLVAACGTTSSATPATSGSATPTPSGEPGTSAEPTGAPTEAPSGEATAPPSGEPPASPGASASPGSAAACTGNDNNRAWYEGLAQAVTWDVYCPVLPAGWFVVSGNYSLKGGGKMDITYRGPDGQRIEIRQGTYCAGQEGCIPTGPDVGTASYGDRPARLVDAGGGAWLVVAEGGDVDWEAKGIGMDGPTLAGHTAAFAKVGG